MNNMGLLAMTASLCVLGACDKKDVAPVPPPSRFQAVTKSGAKNARLAKAEKAFCEETFSKNERPYQTLKERALPFGTTPASKKGLRWINFWATWCGPCVDEFPLLKNWERALKKEGHDFGVEYYSADDDKDALAKFIESSPLAKDAKLHWLKEGTLAESMTSFGIDMNSPIPVHALVDASDHIRCVRVGAVHEGDFPNVKVLMKAYGKK